MPPLTGTRWITAWQWSWVGVLLALISLLILAAVIVRSGPRRPNLLRIIGFVVLGVGSLLYVTCGPIGVYSSVVMWTFGAKVAVLSAVTPIGLGLGRPSGGTLAEALPGPILRVCRVLAFPGLSSVLVTVSVLLVFLTGYGQASLTSGWVDAVLVVHLLLVGSLVTLPLLIDGLLPDWAGPGIRALLSVLDGLLDAIPGIILMTLNTLVMPQFPGYAPQFAAARNGLSPGLDQKFAGGALLAIAEAVGLPVLALVFVEWIRHDAAKARSFDEEDDARLAAARVAAAARKRPLGADEPATDAFDDDLPEGMDRPWWLTERRADD